MLFRFFKIYSPVAQLVEQLAVHESRLWRDECQIETLMRDAKGDVVMKDKRKYKDRKEYLIKAVYARRKKVRAMAVAYKGGKCERCGYDRCIDALEFHHKDPAQKDFSISSKGYTRSWDRVKKELDKCTILCANCHRELHAKVSSL